MKVFSAKSLRIVSAVLPAVFMLILLPSINAQERREPPSGAARPSPTGGGIPEAPRQPSIRERQYKIIEMERELAKVRTPDEEKLALAQIGEDFEKLQVINNKMMSVTMGASTPDYARVAETASEIKMRANRMKDNLRLAKVEAGKDEKGPVYMKAPDAGGLKTNLLSLDGVIMSFIKNPIFTNPGVVNVSQAEKASRDLETILEFSHLINKDAQRLAKSGGKNP
ncbi:MAG: hypothetical protein H7Z16_14095 [Pyrinomonadaceae bacterium]|nr:hypothetical protein [Pyrinomonadaceae bacterium]